MTRSAHIYAFRPVKLCQLKYASHAQLLLTLLTLVAAPLSVEAQITVLRNVTVIDGNGGPPRRNAAIVIEADKIKSITDAKATLPAGATSVDLSGKTVMPEIINSHGHLGLLKGTQMSADNYTDANIRRQLLQYQDYGVGAVLVLGTDNDDIYARREDSHRGTLPGAMIYTAGRGFGVAAGAPPIALGMTAVQRPTTVEQARSGVDELAAHKPDIVKIWVDDFWGQFPKMQPEIYTAIIEEAHKQNLRVASHVYHLSDAQSLVDAGVNVLAHSVRDAEIPDSLVAEMKRKQVAYIGTLSVDNFAVAYETNPSWIDQPFFRNALEPGAYELITSAKYQQTVKDNKITAAEREAKPIALRNIKKLFDAGVLVALGTDSGAGVVRPIGFAEHFELQLLVQSGLTPLQAITVATKNGAQLLNVSSQFGTLAPGLKANFIVLDKDPSSDIKNTETISSVWKNGKKVSDGPKAASH